MVSAEFAGPRSYTKAELLQAARDAGFTPSGRLLTDWVTLGLLDQAQRRGLGHGKGTTATWPENQLKLFIALLEKRPQVKRIVALCNIPIWLWLWFGDDFVSLRQARRALATWAGARGQADSWQAARGSAEELIGKFAHPDASRAARERLTEVIARTAYGKPFEADEVLAAFRPVFDPKGEGRTIGSPELSFRPEHYVFIIESRLAALAGLRSQTTLDDGAFEWARTEYRVSRRDYAALVPRIAADPEAADAFLHRTQSGLVLAPTLDDIVNQSCVDLLTVLGIHLRSDRSAGVR